MKRHNKRLYVYTIGILLFFILFSVIFYIVREKRSKDLTDYIIFPIIFGVFAVPIAVVLSKFAFHKDLNYAFNEVSKKYKLHRKKRKGKPELKGSIGSFQIKVYTKNSEKYDDSLAAYIFKKGDHAPEWDIIVEVNSNKYVHILPYKKYLDFDKHMLISFIKKAMKAADPAKYSKLSIE